MSKSLGRGLRTNRFTAAKAQFLNMQEDGLKIRAAKFKNMKAYDRKSQTWKKDT